jgi:transcriptional repressor NrdR
VRCPFCNSEESKVVDSRDSESGDAIRRRRECLACERRYTTYERLEEVPLVVVKRDGSEEVFARQKLLNGMLRASEKRRIPLERLERAVDDIENELRRVPGRGVTTQMVGERALQHLREIDKVAYVRFASVYRQFDDIDEFQDELARLERAGAEPLPGEEPLPGIGGDGIGGDGTGDTDTITSPLRAVTTTGERGA